MLLDRLESGFLLLETKQGFVRVDLSFQQRVLLLWTFRHFRQLSPLLLSARERALIDRLFRHNAGIVSDPEESWPVIGVIENFKLTAEQSDELFSRTEQVPKLELPYKEMAYVPEVAAVQIPKIPSTADRGLFSSLNLKLLKLKLNWSKVATVAGAMSLCVLFGAAWHRIERIPASQASELRAASVNTIDVPDVLPAIQASPIAESPITETQALAAPQNVKRVSMATLTSKSKRADRVSTPDSGVASDEAGIQVSRPPLRVIYPVYPNARLRGKVALRALVDAQGVVRTVSIVSGNRALANAAVRAVRQWRYRPYMKDGQAVATETNVFISFIAQDAISMSFPSSFSGQ
jgi:TonB family protein